MDGSAVTAFVGAFVLRRVGTLDDDDEGEPVACFVGNELAGSAVTAFVGAFVLRRVGALDDDDEGEPVGCFVGNELA